MSLVSSLRTLLMSVRYSPNNSVFYILKSFYVWNKILCSSLQFYVAILCVISFLLLVIPLTVFVFEKFGWNRAAVASIGFRVCFGLLTFFALPFVISQFDATDPLSCQLKEGRSCKSLQVPQVTKANLSSIFMWKIISRDSGMPSIPSLELFS